MNDDRADQRARLQSNVDRLRAAIDGLAGMPDAQRPLQEQLTALERQLEALQAASPTITSPNAARDVNIATHQTIHNYGAAGALDRDTLLREYLLALGGECNRLSLADADSSDPTRAAVELAAVYTGLEVARRVPLTEQDKGERVRLDKDRQQRALEALATKPRLALLGEPGSGKSTSSTSSGCAWRALAWASPAGWSAWATTGRTARCCPSA